MRESQPILPLLRSRVQGDLLALLYLHPGRDYSLTETADIIGASLKAVHAEASRLADAGFIADSRRGTSRLIRAVTDSPVSQPLTDLLVVTYGPVPVLTDLLRGVEGVEKAFIFGSWAARYQGEIGGIPNDVDVLVVGTVDRDALYGIAEAAQDKLGREVNVHRADPATWASPPPSDVFYRHLHERPLVELKVSTA